MNSSHIFWPVLAQILLTLIMFMVLRVRKAKAGSVSNIDRQQAALDNKVWPESVVKVSNNIANQFETPVLFYVLCLVIYTLDAVGMIVTVLAWLYVLSRYAHAYVHVGSNYVPMRLRLFLSGCVILLALLILVVWELAMGSVAV